MSLRITRHAGKAIQISLGIAGAIFIVLAFRETWNRSRGVVFPSAWRLIGAAILIGVGRLSAAVGWSRLFGKRAHMAHLRAFLLTQPAKYVPGGIWQMVGQVDLMGRSGVGIDRAVVALPAWVVVQVVAASLVGATLFFFGTIQMLPRSLSLLGLLPLLLMKREWLVRLISCYARWRGKRSAAELVPSRRAMFVAMGWSVLTLVLSGAGFGLILNGTGSVSVLLGIPLFALAWVVGFIVLPVPAGVGIREAVMIALIGAAGGATIAASILQRLLTILLEAMLSFAFVRSAWRRADSTKDAQPVAADGTELTD